MNYIRPNIQIDIYELYGGPEKRYYWDMFKRHHYLNHKFNLSSRCFVGLWGNEVVAYNASLCLPGKCPPLYKGDTRTLKYRDSRTVVLPDFQGLGIGTRFTDTIGEHFISIGIRYFGRTAHVRVGEYRQHSSNWRPTSTNLKKPSGNGMQSGDMLKHWVADVKRTCYSHEFLGEDNEHKRKYLEEQEQKKNKGPVV